MDGRVGQPPEGARQLGNYRLLNLLGQGSFAEVYLGEHIYLPTKAAIKLLYARVTKDEVAIFQQEARTLAQLVHPNIVRVLDFGVQTSTNTPYLVMDYAPGGTLRQHYPKGTRLPLSVVVEYVKQVAAALQYGHDKKFIHRDIKPENILLGDNGELLLSDFGIALFTQNSRYQSSQDMLDTIAYMAPEQIRGRPEQASDQYALAVMVYEWLCGKLPFREGNALNIQYQHVHEPVPPLHEQLTTISPAVEQVVLKALAKQPQERFSSVAAFATALEQASHDPYDLPRSPPSVPSEPPILAVPPVRQQSETMTSRGISRRRVLLEAGGLVGVSVVGAGIWRFTHLPSSYNPPMSKPQGTLYLTYRGHTHYVEAVAWSPDGKLIASGGRDKTVQVWDATTGGHVFTYHGHADAVFGIAWSPDSKRIASGSVDSTVQVWDVANGNNVFIYRGHSGGVNGILWSPDGQRIASAGNDQTVQVWDATTGDHVFIYHGHSDIVYGVAWSPDGKRIASGSVDKTVQVWDATTGDNPFIYHGNSDRVTVVAWSPDGRRIVSGSVDSMVQVWDAADGGNIFIYRRHTDWVGGVAWSPDSKRIVSGSLDKTVQVWDAANGGHVFTYHRHTNWVGPVVWSPDGQRIASGSADKTVQVWQV